MSDNHICPKSQKRKLGSRVDITNMSLFYPLGRTMGSRVTRYVQRVTEHIMFPLRGDSVTSHVLANWLLSFQDRTRRPNDTK